MSIKCIHLPFLLPFPFVAARTVTVFSIRRKGSEKVYLPLEDYTTQCSDIRQAQPISYLLLFTPNTRKIKDQPLSVTSVMGHYRNTQDHRRSHSMEPSVQKNFRSWWTPSGDDCSIGVGNSTTTNASILILRLPAGAHIHRRCKKISKDPITFMFICIFYLPCLRDFYRSSTPTNRQKWRSILAPEKSLLSSKHPHKMKNALNHQPWSKSSASPSLCFSCGSFVLAPAFDLVV